jgi:hypothetical protein
MTNDFYDISTIESYLRGEIDPASRQAFEAQLAADEALRKEVDAYGQILRGFRYARQEQFAGEVAKWTEEARNASIEQEAEKGKVISIDRGATLRTLYRRVALAASVILLVGIGAAWWISQQYTNAKLVASVYSPPLASGTMGGQSPQASEIERQFESAHRLFQKANYREAAQLFDRVVLDLEGNPTAFDNLTRKFYFDNAMWSRLLARFAGRQLTQVQFTMELERIAADPANEYAPNAKALLDDLSSFWRKLGLSFWEN